VEEPWTILELAELAAETLGASDPARSDADAGLSAEAGALPGRAASGLTRSGSARANGRVRDVPNERLVRWYVTVGLVDPPLSRRGRVARYGRRHLLQLVAVKRRQAEGRSLAEIQAELAGATNETLAAVARVPDTLPLPDAPVAAPGRFWTRQPGQAKRADADGPGQSDADDADGPGRLEVDDGGGPGRPDADDGGGPGRPDADDGGGPGRPDADDGGGPGRPEAGDAEGPGPVVVRGVGRAVAAGGKRARPLAYGGHADRGAVVPAGGIVRGVRLAPGVTLLLEGADREPGPDDVAEIISAARPLLAELASRRLYADHLE
jgi:DNA-binding transcriptional MerR regulator